MFQEVTIDHEKVLLKGHLSTPSDSVKGWVIFAHGSGSSRHSPRNNWVATELNKHGFATFLFDLLTPKEDLIYRSRFNIPLLASRLLRATEWLIESKFYGGEAISYYGASTGAAAALMATAKADPQWPLFTVISRGGRPDLAEEENLRQIYLPVLLIVGSLDREVIHLNRLAQKHLVNAELVLVPGASHLFEEPGTLNEVVRMSCRWLEKQMGGTQRESLHGSV